MATQLLTPKSEVYLCWFTFIQWRREEKEGRKQWRKEGGIKVGRKDRKERERRKERGRKGKM